MRFSKCDFFFLDKLRIFAPLFEFEFLAPKILNLNFQIHANKFSDAALDTFLSCTRKRCCDQQSSVDDSVEFIWGPPVVNAGDCKKTTDEYGRMDANFPDHTGIGQSDS